MASERIMDCNEYRVSFAGDPAAFIEGGAEHPAGCEACSRFTTEMQAFNDKIAKALAIQVPDMQMPALPAIEDDNVVNLPFGGKKKVSMPAWIGLAATVVMAAFVGVRMFDTGHTTSGSTLADQVLAHVDHEPGALRITDVAVSGENLAKVVSPAVSKMDEDMGLISYARVCTINGKVVPHLVIQGEKGPITLLLMSEEEIDGATELDGKGVKGVILPVGNGSIAIISERDEPLTELEHKIINSVEWSI